MKSLPVILAVCLSLASAASAQSEPAPADAPAPVATTAPEAASVVPAAASAASTDAERPYLYEWLGDYAGICAFSEDGSKMAEIPVDVSIKSGTPSRVEVKNIPAYNLITVTVYVSPDATQGARMTVTADTMAMSPKYADAVSLDMKRITGGFGGTEALIDGEVKVYQISLSAAPKPMRTYRFRIGPQ
jgi:hypothetical protein